MALETGVTYIEDLVDTNPVAGDDVEEGQNHLNIIKTAVQGSFPSLGAAAVTKTAAQINDLVEQTDPVLNGTISGTAFLDEDTMSSDSAIAVASQQSIKAYVDTISDASMVTVATQTASASSALTFGSIPAGTKKVLVNLKELANATSVDMRIQFGISTGFITTGYQSGCIASNTLGNTHNAVTGHFTLTDGVSSGNDVHGILEFLLQDASTNVWVLKGVLYEESGNTMHTSAGVVTLTDTLTQFKIYADSGNLASGTVGVTYEQ